MKDIYEKLKILADSAKFDVSCSSSGVGRKNKGRMGNASHAGICHSWTADGRCISLLKILFTNKCAYDCAYCINARSRHGERVSFEPEELARLTMEFYRRNYIEGLFLSSAVEISPDHTAERILHGLMLLRHKYGFAGYIHAKIIPGVSSLLVHAIGLEADRLSINAEFSTREGLQRLAPQKKVNDIFSPMKQITNTLMERKSLKGPGKMFTGEDLNKRENLLGGSSAPLVPGDGEGLPAVRSSRKEVFAPAGQTTQMIIGAQKETDLQIIKTSENIYRNFKVKRVYYSAYVPVLKSPILPDLYTAPPLAREHRLYQADWLLRFYGFSAQELVDEAHPNLDADMDPKSAWALRHPEIFPMEVNTVSMDQLLRIPGIGTLSALRIVKQRRHHSVGYEDLKKMGVVLKRAKFFLTCKGKYLGGNHLTPEKIREEILRESDGVQISLFNHGQQTPFLREKP